MSNVCLCLLLLHNLAEAASTTAYKCPNFDACIGGSDEASYCEEGFEGPCELLCNN